MPEKTLKTRLLNNERILLTTNQELTSTV